MNATMGNNLSHALEQLEINESASRDDGQSVDVDYDFSFLPETVWVKVFEFLPLSDQYRVSCTCHHLYDIFNHPSNWKSCCLGLIGGYHNFGMNYSFMPAVFMNIVEKFGQYFQRLTISLEGHLVSMWEDVRNIILHMSQVCRLEHLVLEVGILTSVYHLEGIRPFEDDLKALLSLVDTAFRLKKIDIISWPMFPEIFDASQVNIFEALKRNDKLKSLQSLSLFGLKNKQWSQRAPLLPSPAYTWQLVSHFQHLEHLSLRSPMLSEELMMELASPTRERLLTLQILLTYVAYDHQYRIPEISSKVWSALHSRSPRLEVELVIMSRVPDMDLAAVLKPEVPLTAIRIFKYARCSQDLMYTLSVSFQRTLRSFICYTDPTDCGPMLQQLVRSSPRLDTMVFHGQCHVTQLLDIAQQKEKWKELEFVKSQIMTEPQEDPFDDDIVIGQRANGNLVQVGIVRFHGEETEEQREEQLNMLCAEVSSRVGYSWKPLENWQLPS